MKVINTKTLNMSRLTIIVAATKSNGIGQGSKLPWRLPKEMKYFAQVTTQAPVGHKNLVLMGRTTWESIPPKFRPLPNRLNVVISRNKQYQLGPQNDASQSIILADSLDSSFVAAEAANRIFIIGGASLYRESLLLPTSGGSPFVDRILLTRIVEPDFQCDVFMPDFNAKDEWLKSTHNELQDWVGFTVPEGIQEENGVKYEFQMWTRKA
ncbi:dihydrofolate reductase [Coprinopsis marcescibilis]|uniref:Dihydrofolate reductase n=1 Tax=Coprinopsis marcescibilis TaxID=230819 RepID=A0A5C3LNX2_COPMA|nr:dihydrofolate reductase [Coprinopsis marcescibilis]